MMNNFRNWTEKGIVYSFYALIYFLPISTALVEIFSTCIILCYLSRMGVLLLNRGAVADGAGGPVRDSSPSEKMFFGACVLFLAANILSTLTSQYPWVSFKALFFKLSQGLVLMHAFSLVMLTQKRIKIFITVFLVSATLSSVNAIFQSFSGHGFVRGFSLVEEARVTSSFKHPNDFGGYLIVVSSVVLSLIVTGIYEAFFYKKQQESVGGAASTPVFVWIWIGSLLILTLWSLGLTFSRGAWLGFIIAVLCLAFYRKKVFFLLIGLCVLFLLIFHPQLYKVRGRNLRVYNPKGVVIKPKDVKKIMAPDQEPPPSAQDRSLKNDLESQGHKNYIQAVFKKVLTVFEVLAGKSMGRFGFWKEAMLIVKDYPLCGAGLNTYSKVAPRYKINWGGYPHNCYLHMAAETGVLGLGLFLGLVVIFLCHAWTKIHLVTPPYLLSVSLGGVAGLSGFLVQCFFDTNLYSVQLNSLFWIFIGLVLAAIRTGRPYGSES